MILGQTSVRLGKTIETQIIFRGNILQFAGAAADTMKAILGMMSQDKFQDGPAGFQHPGRGRPYDHAFTDLSGTSRYQIFLTLHFHHTDPAIGLNFLIGMGAKGGYFYSCSCSSF